MALWSRVSRKLTCLKLQQVPEGENGSKEGLSSRKRRGDEQYVGGGGGVSRVTGERMRGFLCGAPAAGGWATGGEESVMWADLRGGRGRRGGEGGGGGGGGVEWGGLRNVQQGRGRTDVGRLWGCGGLKGGGECGCGSGSGGGGGACVHSEGGKCDRRVGGGDHQGLWTPPS